MPRPYEMPDTSETRALESSHPGRSEHRKPGILIVDDTQEIRDFLRVGLRYYGFAVWVSASGRNAVSRYRSKADAIDAVLLDVSMPDWDGPRTFSALRKIHPDLPCCFMSGGTGDYSVTDLLRIGAPRVFRKPFRLRDVAEYFQKMIADKPFTSEGIVHGLESGEGEESLRENPRTETRHPFEYSACGAFEPAALATSVIATEHYPS